MAAMAPALTDAPADTHRIRFNLAPSSSALNPSAVEANGANGRILVTTNGAVKRKASSEEEKHRSCGSGPFKKEESARDLGKIQQLVTSYRCSDESLKLQNVFGMLPGFLPRKHQALELSEEQIKSIMNAGNASAPCGMPLQQGAHANVNGMAKKLKSSKDSNGVTLNGGNHGQEPLPHTHAVASHGELSGNGSLEGSSEAQQSAGVVSRECPNDPESPPPPQGNVVCSLDLLGGDLSVPCPSPSQFPFDNLGSTLRDRTQQVESRHVEIEGRLRRLRKRLQVVQAKQVERHVQQQLGGLIQGTLGPPDSRLPQERGDVSRFLKGGSVPAELERLSLSCSTNLRAAEGTFDSDVTESSSGGETDVEEDELVRADVEQRHFPLWRRAEGRYTLERASIISHWNWLQAHVSDLEYRIRQHTDIYRQIRTNKGAVFLGESSACESVSEGSGSVRVDNSTQVHDAEWRDVSVPTHCASVGTSLRKGYTPVRHVNGVLNSLRCSSPSMSEVDQQRPVAPPADPSCVAARTRPLASCRRRRLLRPSTFPNLNKVLGCGCDVSAQCVMCAPRPVAQTHTQFQLPLLDRLAQLDPCVHPILSFSNDVAMGLHLQRVMKCHWQGRQFEKIKPVKKLSLKHKLFSSSRLTDLPASSSSISSSSFKDKVKMNPSLLSTVRLSHHKMRSEKLYRQQQCDSESRQHYRTERSHIRKRPHELSVERIEDVSKVPMEVVSPSASLATPTLSPVVRQPVTLESPTPCSLNNPTLQSIQRKRRGDSPFDINNIVIPMSVAASTRVEKLQYKEILTPSWREVNITVSRLCEEDGSVEIEDLSDAVFSQLHLPYEEQERSRWSWTSKANAKRRGSRSYKSVDGRSTPLLGGTNPSTPQPSSPDPHFPLLQDYSSAPSPSSPASPDFSTHSQTHALASRDSHRFLSNEDTRCSTPDTIYDETPMQPWERRTFPLDTDPPPELEHHDSPGCERMPRTARRISSCRSGSRSECDGEPQSPPPPPPAPEDPGKHRSSVQRPAH